MADLNTYANATPVLTDEAVGNDDPGGTWTVKTFTFAAIRTLLEANLVQPIITVAAANTAALVSTGYSLTGSDATSMIDVAGTWNTTGAPTALKLNVTDTASNAASLLMDLQVGAASKFSVAKAGDISMGGDVNLFRDAAQTLALRDGVNPNAFNIYNTWTDASNYERGFIKYESNILKIGHAAAGTGTSNRQISFYGNGGTTERLRINGGSGLWLPASQTLDFNSNIADNIIRITMRNPTGDQATTPANHECHIWRADDSTSAASNGDLLIYANQSDNGTVIAKFVLQHSTVNGSTEYIAVSDTSDGSLTTKANPGVAGTGTTAVEYGDGFNRITVLTMAGVLPAIAGGAALAVGLLVYTFPAGVTRVKSVHMDVGIDGNETNIDADTPEVGVGSVIATGAVAVLNGTTGFDDYVTETTAANCTGTTTDFSFDTVDAGLTLNDAAGTKTMHLNAADNWAASGDTAAALSGTITIEWTFLGA